MGEVEEVILTHLNPSPWKTRLEGTACRRASPRVDGGALITLRHLSSRVDFHCAVFSRKHQRSEGSRAPECLKKKSWEVTSVAIEQPDFLTSETLPSAVSGIQHVGFSFPTVGTQEPPFIKGLTDVKEKVLNGWPGTRPVVNAR